VNLVERLRARCQEFVAVVEAGTFSCAALEKIKDDTGRWNKRLAMPRREQEGRNGDASPPKVPRQRKTA
jgi:hypothetical protein